MTTFHLNRFDFINRFGTAHIYTDDLTSVAVPEHPEACDRCLKTLDDLSQKVIFWIRVDGIYLISLRLCVDCHATTTHNCVTEASGLDELLQEFRQESQPQAAQTISIGSTDAPLTVATQVYYFKGGKPNCCNVCSMETDTLIQKIYICHYRPKRRQPGDTDIILFSFDLCEACHDKTSLLNEGPARFDWDIIDLLHCEVNGF